MDVMDPIEAHVLTFAGEGRRFALVVLDLICVNVDLAQRIRDDLIALGIDDTWTVATHTHSGPDVGCLPRGSITSADIADRVTHAAARAAALALADERPTTIGHSRASSTGVAERRNVPPGVETHLPVDVLTFRDTGTLAHRGVLVVTPIHPTVLPAENRRISADLNGSIRRAVVARFGGWAVAATGSAGDVSTRTTRLARTSEEVDRLGHLLVAGLDSAVAAEAPAGSSTVVATARTALLRPNAPTGRRANPRDSEADAFGSDVWAARRRTVFDEAVEYVAALGGHPSHPVEVEVRAVRLGELRLVGVGGELFLSVGERIRATADGPIIVLGYVDGYVGYLPERDTPDCYETVISPIDPASIDLLVTAASDALDSV
jgi:hypothetical protein